MVRNGHTGEGVFMGPTLFEHGIGKRGVWLNASHYVTCAMTGAGKSATSLNFRLIFHPGSMVVISPKPEHVNFALGRRTDPTLFLRPEAEQDRRPGCYPRDSKARFHLPNGRCFNLDAGKQSAFDSDRYTLLSDVWVDRPGAIGRLLAISSGSFPDNPRAKEQWFIKAPRIGLAATWGHVLTTVADCRCHTMPFGLRLLLGIDPTTGVARPDNQTRLFQQMMNNPGLGGWIQSVGSSLYQLGERNFGALNSELQTNAGWMLDPTMAAVLEGPSSFSFEEVGVDGWPVTVFITPPRGEKPANAWLRSTLELMQLVFQQRESVPSQSVAIICDELKFWGAECQSVKDSMNILRDKNVSIHLYTQSYAQLIEMYGEQGAAEVLSASCLQLFGCNDLRTRQFVHERLGQTTCKVEGIDGIVDLASTDAIDRDLSLTSPLQVVLSPGAAPMLLGRVAHKPIRTKEGAFFEGLHLEGHYDEGL
jgi:hypothetical protein